MKALDRIATAVLTAGLHVVLSSAPASAAVISVNIDKWSEQNGFDENVAPMAPGETAGLVPATNWNAFDPSGAGSFRGATPVDDSGALVAGFSVSSVGSNPDSWNSAGTDNRKMWGDMYVGAGTLTISGIPYAEYDLIVYSKFFTTDDQEFSIDDGENVQIVANFHAGMNSREVPSEFDQLVFSNGAFVEGFHYTTFDGLSDAFVVLDHEGMSGFQIIEVPEPSPAFSGGRLTGNFYAVNLDTAEATQIGGENVVGLQSGESFHGLDFAPDGTLYGLTSSRLLTIDLNTGVSQTVGFHGLSGAVAGAVGDLAFDASGTLYGVLDADVFTIDVGNGLASVLGSPSVSFRLSGLAFDLSGKLFATQSFSGDDTLYELSPVDGSIVDTIGDIGAIGDQGANGAQGMDLDVNGQAYLIDDLSEQLFSIDFDTGVLNLVGPTNAARLESLAIPEPSSGLLHAFALLVLAAMRRLH